MTSPPQGRVHAPGRATGVVLTAGVLLAAACFGLAMAMDVVGVAGDGGDMTDLSAVAEGLMALAPWAWASLGTYAIVLTPLAGLVATTWEYASVSDRLAALLSVAVLAVLVMSALVSLLR